MKHQKDKIPSDSEIVEMFWSRDERAIKEADRKYGRYLFSVGLAFLERAEDIEDAKNDTYLAAWDKIPPERPEVLPAYFTQIMRRVSMDRFRANTAKKRNIPEIALTELELAQLSEGRTPAEEYDAKLLGELITEYVRLLTERQRLIFTGHFYMGMSAEKLAKRLGIGKTTVHRELDKIRSGLRTYLERRNVFI